MSACPLCGHHAEKHLLLSHAAVLGCLNRGCQVRFAFPQLDNEALDTAYRKLYYPDPETTTVEYENTPEEILRQTLQKAEAEWGRLAGKKLLDFGCGVGKLCRIANEYGMDVTGIEPDGNAREKASKNIGRKTYGSLAELRSEQPDAKFDVVTMWDVIEHLRVPWKTVEDLSAILEPNGWLLLSTPNADCLRARLKRQRWENAVNPTHFYYFNRKSLGAVLSRAGLTETRELQLSTRYPGHGLIRRIVQRVLVSCGLQGELVYLARC